MTERQIKLDASKISRSPSEAVKGGGGSEHKQCYSEKAKLGAIMLKQPT